VENGSKDLHAVLQESYVKLIGLQINDSAVARNLSGYSESVELVLKELTITDFLNAFQPVVEQYCKEQNDKASELNLFYKEFNGTLDRLIGATSGVSDEINRVTEQINNKEDQLSSVSVMQLLLEIFRRVMKKSTESEVSTMVGLNVNVLRMTCSDLFKNDVNEKLVLNKLKKFREDLIGISTNIQTLNSTLARVEEHSMTLMHVWNDIDKNLIELKKVDKPQLNVNDQVDVINSWLTLKRFLNNYLNTLSDTNVSGIRSLSYNHHPDVQTLVIPSTPNEKKIL